MGSINRLVFVASIVVGVWPSLAWASICDTQAPLLIVSSQDVYQNTTSYVIAARERVLGCTPETLSIRAAGLPHMGGQTHLINTTAGEAQLEILVVAGTAPIGVYNVTYTATDSMGNSTTASSQLRIGPYNNQTPTLDPIGDYVVGPETVSFTIGLSDLDGGLVRSPETLVVDGLPNGARVDFTRATPGRVAARVTIPGSAARGIYTVHIRGQDRDGGVTLAQMRIIKG